MACRDEENPAARQTGPTFRTEQREHLALELGELEVEDLQGLAVLHELVPRGQAEETQDLFGGRALAVALLRVERQLTNLLALHGKPQLALDDGLHE